MNKKKVLILSNPLNHEGGIVNYYNLFLKYFESEEFELSHMSIGSRAYLFYYPILKRILYPFYFIFDVFKFIIILMADWKIKIVQFSPSLIPVPLIRDGLILIIAKVFRKKIIVFYRGWKLPTYRSIQNSKFRTKLFNWVFQSSTYQYVLAESFKSQLLELNAKRSNLIEVTTTAIEVDKIILSEKRDIEKVEVLFLARIQDLKGINELIEAIVLLKKAGQLQKFKFTIAGHEAKNGTINKLKEHLKSNDITEESVEFAGRLNGVEKYEAYSKSEVYVLPSYTEGCPNSVLEALSSGLFCITTNVGALKDLIKEDRNGKFIDIKSSQALFGVFQEYLKRKEEFRMLNFALESQNKFDIRSITKKFNSKYREICNA